MPGMKMLPAAQGRALAAAVTAAAIAGTVFTGGVSSASATPGTTARTWALPLGVMPLAALPCRASVNNARPQQYTTVKVRVRTASDATVKAVAHYKTTSHAKTGQTGRRGRLSIPYSISDATVGYKVVVDVTVAADGRTGTCSTSFTPQAG